MSDIAWFIPRLIDGSGGHRTMLQHAHALEKAGHQCWLYIEGNGDQRHAPEIVKRMFGYQFERVSFGWDRIKPADAAVATIWYSAAIVRDLPFPCAKAYLVQDYEAVFNPMGDAYLMAENSYRYGLVPITVGKWLSHVLGRRFGVPAYSLDFGANGQTYHPIPETHKERAVCFIYQPDKPRRCARLGIETLGIVKHHMPEVNVYLYGSLKSDAGDIWFDHTHLGLLSLEDCNKLYNRCDVGLCLSSSNPSRIPFEMMAAGLPVVELWRENNLFDLPDNATSLSMQTPESLAENILRLLKEPAVRSRMSTAGVNFMSTRQLFNESEQFVRALENILSGKRPSLAEIAPIYTHPPVVADAHTKSLPPELMRRLATPANVRLNSLPVPLRKLLGWGARKARRYLLDHS